MNRQLLRDSILKFSPLADGDLSALIGVASYKGFPKGTAVLKQGQVCHQVGLTFKHNKLTVLANCCADPGEEVHRVLTTKIFTRHADVMNVAQWVG